MAYTVIAALLVAWIAWWYWRYRSRGQCPHCRFGTLWSTPRVRPPHVANFRVRSVCTCDACENVVIDGVYRVKPPAEFTDEQKRVFGEFFDHHMRNRPA